MSDQTPQEKGPGQGKGRWTRKGVQADEAQKVADLEAAFEAHTADGHGGDQPDEGDTPST